MQSSGTWQLRASGRWDRLRRKLHNRI